MDILTYFNVLGCMVPPPVNLTSAMHIFFRVTLTRPEDMVLHMDRSVVRRRSAVDAVILDTVSVRHTAASLVSTRRAVTLDARLLAATDSLGSVTKWLLLDNTQHQSYPTHWLQN